jgi:hypothetical protein
MSSAARHVVPRATWSLCLICGLWYYSTTTVICYWSQCAPMLIPSCCFYGLASCCKNLACAPFQLPSHLPLTVPTSIRFAAISTSSTRLHSLIFPSTLSWSSVARVSVRRHLHVVRWTNPNGALMIHSMPSSVSVISASNVTVVPHSPLGKACMWSVIL